MSGRLALATEAAPWGLPALILAGSGADDLVAGLAVAGGIQAAVALIFGWLAYRRANHLYRSPFWDARNDLAEALRTLPAKTVCLVRDDHIVLFRSKRRAIGIPVMQVMRLDENDATDFMEHGAAVMTGTTFTVTPIHVRVLQIIHGDRIITGPTGNRSSRKNH